MKFSAADLVKKSAKQILYFYKRNENFPVTERMIKGNEFAERISTSEFLEMRGTYEISKEHTVHFTWDEIKADKNNITFIEIKNVEGKYEDWFLESSLLQVAFYYSMSLLTDEFFTAKFARKKYKTKYLNIKGKNLKNILIFGKEKYQIEVISPEKIIEYFIKKANKIASLSYEITGEYDSKHKFKHYQKCKSFFNYEKLQ